MSLRSLYTGSLCAIVFSALFVVTPLHIFAQEVVSDEVLHAKAVVLDVLVDEDRIIPGTDVFGVYQELQVQILTGPEKDAVVTITNDYLPLSLGQKFYLVHTKDGLHGTDWYSVSDPDRMPQMIALVILFVSLVCVFGGKQGIRGLASLVGSFAFIFLFLLPGILHGYSPILVSIFVSSLVIIFGSYVTHGFSKMTSSAVIGMIATVSVTGMLAYGTISWTQLTGFESEESVYLNLNTGGSIDFSGLLLGGMLIGLLGVLYDAAIGQAVSVEELHRVGPHLSRRTIFARASRIGREHIGALVNTLAIAYVGASLPLLLLFKGGSELPVSIVLNREVFAAEIVRTLIGSIGLVLAVPITTLISVLMLVKPKVGVQAETSVKNELEATEHLGHTHIHKL